MAAKKVEKAKRIRPRNRKNVVTGTPQVNAQDRDIDKVLLERLSAKELQDEAYAALLDLLKNRSERTVLWYWARFVGNPSAAENEKQNRAASITFNFAGVQMSGPPVFDKPTAPSLQE